MQTLNFSTRPKFLFLSQDPALITRQLAGEALSLSAAGALRAEISTDEISPMASLVYFDKRSANHPYTGLKTGGQTPIKKGSVKQGGFNITVAGARFGKGSSREHSPLAEKLAGIQLVIAESFERIYRQNADNIGLLTSTDFGLIPRLEKGEVITLDELLQDRDPVSRELIKAGGLLGFGQAQMRGLRLAPLTVKTASDKPQTLFEKIIARHTLQTAAHKTSGAIYVKPSRRYIHDIYTAMCAAMLRDKFGETYALFEPESILAFEDHYSYTHQSPMHLKLGLAPQLRELSRAHRNFVKQHQLTHHGYLSQLENSAITEGSEGISHALVAERYALPGQLIAATDSHTPHSGALGCVAFGVGTTDMANAFMTGAVRLTVPPQMNIELAGKLPAGISAKDIMLHLLSLPAIRAGAAMGKVVEFTGAVAQQLNIDERATLTNMCAELGAFTGLFAPDAQTLAFLKERRGLYFTLAPWLKSDVGAAYDETLKLDCSQITPMLAAPGDPGKGIALRDLRETVAIDIAYGGSCTAGKREDFDQYHTVLQWAAKRGLRVAKGVTLYLQFGTQDVRDYCIAQGYMIAFEAVGATLLQPACGACANCGPGVTTDEKQITISAINRNFAGRVGPGSVWLASPATVAASAIAGQISGFAQLQNSHAV